MDNNENNGIKFAKMMNEVGISCAQLIDAIHRMHSLIFV